MQNVLGLAPAHAYINISFARRPLPGSVRAAVRERSRRCDPVSRAAERRVGEGEAKGGRTLAQCPVLARLRPSSCPLMGEVPSAKAECTRQSPPQPVRSSRVSPPKTAPLPAYGRITVCKGGSAQGNPRSCPCVLPASAYLRPCTLPAYGRSAVRSSRVSPPTAVHFAR